MKRRWLLLTSMLPLAVAVAALGGVSAEADGDGVAVGGSVPSEIALSIGAPTAFTRIGTGTYQMTIPVQLSSTEVVTKLSIADGEDPSGPAHGHLRSTAGLIAAPLQVGLAGQPLRSLAAPLDPLLSTWTQPLAEAPAVIDVQQRLTKGSIRSGAPHTILLVTVSSQTP